MTNGISIKIHNAYGVNSIKGTDISKEETLQLIGLAKELIAQQNPVQLSTLQYHEGTGIPVALDEIAAPLKPIVSVAPNTAVRPAPIKATPMKMTDYEQPIKLGATPNPDVKRITPRAPVILPEEEPAPIIEPNQKVYSTPGVTPVNSLGDKLVDTFQTSQGIAPLTAPATEFLTVDEQLAELNKNYHETGIKHKVYGGEITPMYRVRCECPSCGEKGNHYVPENKKDVNCYECRTPILIEPAAGKFPERDEWGNFFVATKTNPRWQKA